MDLLALFVVASVIGASLVAWVIVWTTNQSTESAITRHFKASEYILDTGQPPPAWLRAPLWKRLIGAETGSARDEIALMRLDELIRFFEQCSFYEDEYAREQHLAQLDAVKKAWHLGKTS